MLDDRRRRVLKYVFAESHDAVRDIDTFQIVATLEHPIARFFNAVILAIVPSDH